MEGAGAPQHPPPKPLVPDDITGIRNRFLAVNRQRLLQAEQALPARQRVFLELLPFLFHVNHPMLPGFSAQECPMGLAMYTPPATTIASARRIARSFDYKRKAPRQFDIEAVYLMGSAGTIAYSRHSDFDIWLCHRPDLPAQDVGKLRDKAALVSAWARELGLEAYFFVMTAADFRAGRLTDLSHESSGTAQRHLLLDEFYRTAMLAGGRYPLWWLVPPDTDMDYTAYTRRLTEQRFVKPGETVDFGGLDHIPSNEFFGASLWQLYKAMDSPYKSILKILLLETYAAEYPEVALLSRRYKQNIYAGRVGLADIDPYVQLFRKVEKHLSAGGDHERLELARQAFFHRTSHHLRRPAGDDGAKHAFLATVCREWGWDEGHVKRLQARGDRRLEQVLAERNLLMNALMTSYRFLSGFARERREIMAISEHDMTVLGRRLFAAFERKAGKVQRVFEGFVQDLYEPHLNIEKVVGDHTVSWLLYRGGADDGDAATPLHRAYTLVEMLAWCHFNGVVQTTTQVNAGLHSSPGEFRELDAVRTALRRLFPQQRFTPPTLERLSQPACPQTAGLFINVGVAPPEDYARRLDALESGRDDPLNSGNARTNLVRELDLVYVTTWQEVFVFHYAGDDGLRDCLAQLLALHHQAAQQHIGLTLETFGFSADRGMVSATRLKELHEDITSRLANDGDGGRFVVKAGNGYHLLAMQDGKPMHRHLGDYASLLGYFSRSLPDFLPVYFDRYAEADSPLPAVFRSHRRDAITFLYFPARGRAYIYVLDEGGALFHDVQPLHREASLLAQFSRFFDAIDYRETAGATFTGMGMPERTTRYYRLEHRLGRFERVPVKPPAAPGLAGRGELQVITERIGDRTELAIYYDDREFSTLDHGKRLFEVVARHILQRRNEREPYPIHITDIDLAGIIATDSPRRGRTAQYLRYKKRIERQLNNALRANSEF
ncbi:MAG: class I adenylate cyclase [Gammaproteobacteria bacterium]|nr:class I adenylate cyclase [Gammaproteobacteria bacterium]